MGQTFSARESGIIPLSGPKIDFSKYEKYNLPEFKDFVKADDLIELKSLIVKDVTPLLTSGIYRSPREPVLTLHNDFLVKFNPSITTLVPSSGIYLMKYRAVSSYCSMKHSLEYYRNLIDYNELKLIEESVEQFRHSLFNEIWPTFHSDIVEIANFFKYYNIERNTYGTNPNKEDEILLTYLKLILPEYDISYILSLLFGYPNESMKKNFSTRLREEDQWVLMKIIKSIDVVNLKRYLAKLIHLLRYETKSLAWIYFLFKHRPEGYRPLPGEIKQLGFDDFDKIDGIEAVVDFDRHPESWATASKHFKAHPYSSGWQNYCTDIAGFAILYIDPITKYVRILKELLYYYWPTTVEEKYQSGSRFGDSRIMQFAENSVERSEDGKYLKFNYYISSDCSAEKYVSAICLNAFFVQMPIDAFLANDWTQAEVIFKPNTNTPLCSGLNKEKLFNSLSPTNPRQMWTSNNHGRNWSMFQCPATTGTPPFAHPTNLPCATRKEMEKYWNFPTPIEGKIGTNEEKYVKSVESVEKGAFAHAYTDYFEGDPKIFLSTQFLPHVVMSVNDHNFCKAFKPWGDFKFQKVKKEEEVEVDVEESKEVKEVKERELKIQPKIIDKFYAFHGKYRFSLGTPAIIYSPKEFIAVGHSRFSIDPSSEALSPTNTVNFLRFKAKLKSDEEGPLGRKYLHPLKHYYFMYFYTFSTDTFEIMRMSHSFQVVPHEPYWLEFAAGICNLADDSNQFIVSYGEGDIKCKLIMLNRADIESLLYPVEAMIVDPEVHQFIELISPRPYAPVPSAPEVPPALTLLSTPPLLTATPTEAASSSSFVPSLTGASVRKRKRTDFDPELESVQRRMRLLL